MLWRHFRGVDEVELDKPVEHPLEALLPVAELSRAGVERRHQPFLASGEDRVDQPRVPLPGPTGRRDGAGHLGPEREVFPETLAGARPDRRAARGGLELELPVFRRAQEDPD